MEPFAAKPCCFHTSAPSLPDSLISREIVPHPKDSDSYPQTNATQKLCQEPVGWARELLVVVAKSSIDELRPARGIATEMYVPNFGALHYGQATI